MKNSIWLFLTLSILFFSCASSKKSDTRSNNPGESGVTAIDNTDRDGSSFEKAIIVKSISKEYEYARKNCQGCKFIIQELVFEKKKPYDILTFERPNGESVRYYFDISNFYGKW